MKLPINPEKILFITLMLIASVTPSCKYIKKHFPDKEDAIARVNNS